MEMSQDATLRLTSLCFNAVVSNLIKRVANAKEESELFTAKLALYAQLKKNEDNLKKLGIPYLDLHSNTQSYHLYVMSEEGFSFLKQYNLDCPGVVFDLLFNLAKYPQVFVVVELSEEYLAFLAEST